MSGEVNAVAVGEASANVMPVFSRSFGSWQFSVMRRGFVKDELASHYDKKSAGWRDTLDRHDFARAYRTMIAKVLRQPRYAQDTHDLQVLDFGIGTGAMSLALRQVVGKRFRLEGVDISPLMLQEAKMQLAGVDIEARFAASDLHDLDCVENRFDVVLAAHVIEHFADPRAAIAQLYRLVKPGGLLLCCMTRRSYTGAFVQLIWRTHPVDMQSASKWFCDCGFEAVRAVPLSKETAARRFSIGYVGRKPVH